MECDTLKKTEKGRKMKELNWVYIPKPAPVSYQEIRLETPYSAKHIHMHDCHEINLIRGDMICHVQCNGARSFVKGPALLLQQKGSYHEILRGGEPFESRVVYFDPAAVGGTDAKFLHEDTLFTSALTVIPLSLDEADSFLPYFDLIRDDGGERKLFALFSLLSKMHEMVDSGKETVIIDTKNSYILHVIRRIQDHPEDEMSIESLSLEFHISATKLKEDLKAVTGYSVKRFVMHHRLRRAFVLLENTRFSLAEIALQCGFSGESHLIRAFKKEFGMTPGAFRKNRQ